MQEHLVASPLSQDMHAEAQYLRIPLAMGECRTSSFYRLRSCRHIRLDINGIVIGLSCCCSGLLGVRVMAIDGYLHEFSHPCLLRLSCHMARCYTDAT
jgi:hypothetical protein